MRRYLTNPFSSAYAASSPAAAAADSPATAADASPASPPPVKLPGPAAHDAAHQPAPPPPSPPARSSYVPSLPLAMPSVRKYLFSSASLTPAAASPATPASAPATTPTGASVTADATPQQQQQNPPLNSYPHAASDPTPKPSPVGAPHEKQNGHPHCTASNNTHHHNHSPLHLPHLHLPTLRRRPSGSFDNHDAAAATPPSRGLSSANALMANALNELGSLVDKTIGPVGNISDTLVKRLPHDRLLLILNHSDSDRNRVLMQFLRARQHNASEAMAMISNALRWRKTMNIDIYLRNTVQNMESPLACFPMTVISTPDICKQPVVYGLIRLLDKKKADRTAFQSALLSFLESSYFGDTYVLDEMIIILDFRDWSIRRNAPYRLVKDGIQTLQDYYPERLGRVFLVNYPTTIRAAYTAISPIIDAGAKEKIVWIPDADPSATLGKYLPAKSIPSFLGGQLKARFPPDWPDVEAEFEKAKGSSSHGFSFY